MNRKCLLLLSLAAQVQGLYGAAYSYKILTPPDAVRDSRANGINNEGHVIGEYDGQGFLWDGGTFSAIQKPGASSTIPYGLDDSGRIAGWYSQSLDETSINRGFLYEGGTYKDAGIPGDILGDSLNAISNTDWRVGYFTILGFGTFGYVQSPSGEFEEFNLGTWNITVGLGVNDAGVAVGSALDRDPEFKTQGFIRDGGTATLHQFPGAFYTAFRDINNLGVIVGNAQSCNRCRMTSFLFRDGIFEPIRIAGNPALTVTGVNDAGQISGWFVGTDGVERAFIGTPMAIPEPGTLSLVAPFALLLTARVIRKRTRRP